MRTPNYWGDARSLLDDSTVEIIRSEIEKALEAAYEEGYEDGYIEGEKEAEGGQG